MPLGLSPMSLRAIRCYLSAQERHQRLASRYTEQARKLAPLRRRRDAAAEDLATWELLLLTAAESCAYTL